MILKFLKRIFGKDENKAVQPVAATSAIQSGVRPAEKDKPLGSDIEVASLSLRAILDKLPADLKTIIERLPEPEVKIMLPLNSIVKQLPTGAVRMSLASLLRQAPAGTFRKSDVEGKQMVDVPLSEVFKNIDPRRLSRRSDQRRYDVPDEAGGLFDKVGNGRQAANGAASDAPAPARAEIPQPAETSPEPPARPSVLKMPGIAAPSAPVGAVGNGKAPAPVGTLKIPAPVGGGGELVISFVELAAGWPEGVRSELSCVPGDTRLVIPQQAVSPGLQKGKVVFPWSQVRQWMTPPIPCSVAIADDLVLVLPLKIIAPAFVAATGATKRRSATEIDHSIPDFFGAVPQSAFKLVQEPVPEVPMAKAMSAALQPPPPAPAEAAPSEATLPVPEPAPAPAVLSFAAAPIVEPVQAVESATPEAAVVPVVPLITPQAASASTPAELVRRACALDGVAGAVLALEEGLVVAQSLPDGFSADAFAAFMPQIIARLEKYTIEMLLGATSEITIQTASGPCHIARSGKIYFGTLGRAGENLPDSLRTLTAQLAALNS